MRIKTELANKAFDSSKIEEFKNVWVFCEQREGKMMPTSFELISEGRKLANELGVNLVGLLLGDNVEGIAKELGGYGADEVIVCDHPLLKTYTTDAYAKVLCDSEADPKTGFRFCCSNNLLARRSYLCFSLVEANFSGDKVNIGIFDDDRKQLIFY